MLNAGLCLKTLHSLGLPETRVGKILENLQNPDRSKRIVLAPENPQENGVVNEEPFSEAPFSLSQYDPTDFESREVMGGIYLCDLCASSVRGKSAIANFYFHSPVYLANEVIGKR